MWTQMRRIIDGAFGAASYVAVFIAGGISGVALAAPVFGFHLSAEAATLFGAMSGAAITVTGAVAITQSQHRATRATLRSIVSQAFQRISGAEDHLQTMSHYHRQAVAMRTDDLLDMTCAHLDQALSEFAETARRVKAECAGLREVFLMVGPESTNAAHQITNGLDELAMVCDQAAEKCRAQRPEVFTAGFYVSEMSNIRGLHARVYQQLSRI